MAKIQLTTLIFLVVGQASAQWLGTNPVYFNSGNVGIGTATPSVWFAARTFEFSDTRPVFKLTSTSAAGLSTMVFTNSSVNPSSHLGEFHINYQFDQANSDRSLLRIGSYPEGNIMSLRSDGNVGIGTSSPSSTLHIERPNGGWLQNIRGQATQPGEFIGLKITSGYLNESNKWAGIASVAVDQHSNNTALSFYASSAEKVRIDGTTGNVGIGTTNPQQKLHVKGTVYSTEVKVDVAAGTGPDYVFADNYQLPTLTKVKSYIDQHKHLPEVPSAKEMEANGVNLGEMNLLLLKKIEELTLYMIEQRNESDKQKVVIQILQKELTDLKAKTK